MAIDPMRNQHDPEAGKTEKRKAGEASLDSFPASDPPALTTARGNRAVPPERMMPSDDDPMPPGGATVAMRFADPEAAKLAVESLVREGPIDRRSADIRQAGDGVTVAVEVAPKDQGRIRELLAKAGGER